MRVFIIKRYLETKSYKTICECFKEKFGDEQTLPNSTNKCIIKHFEVHLYLEDVPLMRTEEKREEVCQQIIVTPCVSVHKLTQCIPTLICTSVFCLLKDLHLHLYHVQMRQELKPMDQAKRVSFCNWFLKFTHCGTSVQNNVFLLPMKHECISYAISTC